MPIEEGQLDFRRREATPSPRRWERNLPGSNGVGARAGGLEWALPCPAQPGSRACRGRLRRRVFRKERREYPRACREQHRPNAEPVPPVYRLHDFHRRADDQRMAVAGILPHHVERPIRPVPIQHDQHSAERLRRLARDSLRVDPIVPLRGIACRMAVSAEHGSAAATSSAASGARVILSPASAFVSS